MEGPHSRLVLDPLPGAGRRTWGLPHDIFKVVQFWEFRGDFCAFRQDGGPCRSYRAGVQGCLSALRTSPYGAFWMGGL